MKVAVCMSGEPRYWRNAVENIKSYFGEVDYFFHIWDSNTQRTPPIEFNYGAAMARRQPIAPITQEHHDYDDLVAAYQPKGIMMEKQDGVKDQTFDSLFYSLQRSVLLKREYEIENGFIYDIVIKARPDVIYLPGTHFNRIKPAFRRAYSGVFFRSQVDFCFMHPQMDDIFFYGDSLTMDLLSSAYTERKVKFKNVTSNEDYDPSVDYDPGCILYELAQTLGIYPADSHPDMRYAIIRESAQHLDGIRDYEEINLQLAKWYGFV